MHSKSDTQNCGHEGRHNDAAHGAHAHHDVPAHGGRGERCGAHGSGHGHHGQARRHHAHKSMRAYERGFEAGFAAASRLIAAA